jgi:hypothetical protein
MTAELGRKLPGVNPPFCFPGARPAVDVGA